MNGAECLSTKCWFALAELAQQISFSRKGAAKIVSTANPRYDGSFESLNLTSMSPEIIALIGAIAGLVAAAAALWAVRAAEKSAAAAQEALGRAEKLDRHGLLRELIMTAHRLIAESSEIGMLVEELKSEYRTLATASGQSGSAREKVLVQRAELKQKEAVALQEQAQKLIEERAQHLHDSADDLTAALTTFDGYLVQVLGIKNSLEREIAAAAGENRVQRESRLRGFAQRG
jgi:hypothetical protein